MSFMGPRHHGLVQQDGAPTANQGATSFAGAIQVVGAQPVAVLGTLTPILVGVASNNVGNPTVPTHQAGDKLVSISASSLTHGGGAPGITTPGWTLWRSIVGSKDRSLSVYRITAAGAGTLCEWTAANAPRIVWVFRNADFDSVETLDGPSSTVMDWPALPGMAANCLVAAYVMSRNTQTDINQIDIAGFNVRVNKDSIPAAWAGDSDPTLLDAFNPANDTFDTITSGHVSAAFSMRGVQA